MYMEWIAPKYEGLAGLAAVLLSAEVLRRDDHRQIAFVWIRCHFGSL
jgi:hypothetical protein